MPELLNFNFFHHFALNSCVRKLISTERESDGERVCNEWILNFKKIRLNKYFLILIIVCCCPLLVTPEIERKRIKIEKELGMRRVPCGRQPCVDPGFGERRQQRR